jgi:hypothetical protein
LNLFLSFDAQAEHWANIWSIADFASMLEKVIEDRDIPELRFSSARDLRPQGVLSVERFAFRVSLHAREETVQQTLQQWSPIIKDICEQSASQHPLH